MVVRQRASRVISAPKSVPKSETIGDSRPKKAQSNEARRAHRHRSKSDSVVTELANFDPRREVRFDLDFDNIPDVIRRRARESPAKVAVIDEDVEYTYGDIWAMVRSAAGGFRTLNMKKGDRFAVLLENRLEWIVGVLGGLALGGVLVPVSTRFVGAEVSVLLQLSGARYLLVSTDGPRDYWAGVAGHISEAESIETVIVVGEAPVDTLSWNLFLSTPANDDQLDELIDALGPDDISDIMFTSGTTGTPKGVIARHGQSIRAHGQLTTSTGYTGDDRVMVIPPFFHSWGYKSGWLGCMLQGSTSVPVRRHDALRTMATIERHRVTALPGPPTIFLDILDSPARGQFDLSSLRLAFPAATSVPASLVLRIRHELGIEFVTTAYGLTETMATVTANSPTDTVERITETVGKPIPGCEVRIVDTAVGHVLGVGETGEIEVRGFNVTSGYWDSPEATSDLFDGEWARTGDIGSVDEEGYVCVTDRKKDMFIVGGFNAYPAEIEAVLTEYPGAQRVAVTGVPDERAGEVGAAFIVPRPGRIVDPADVVTWSQSRLANFKVPRYVYVVDDLVCNPSGKVLKSALREQHLASMAARSGAAS